MKYGCIGEKLGHSFSKEIHGMIADYDYTLRELPKESVGEFIRKKDFQAINVTIPYKETVMPYLDHIDKAAMIIGSVNTVVNRDGVLYGYNTDFYGMSRLIEKCGVDPAQKKVLILGSGGTSKTAFAVATDMGAGEIIKVSRSKKGDMISYEDMYAHHTDADMIINTTPVGMFPDISGKSVDVSRFSRLLCYVDAVYNPLRPTAVLDALSRGISASGGLYMLVAQAVRASEIFLNTSLPKTTLDTVFNKICAGKENAVLIGMPSSGKSTVGRLVAESLERKFIDTDDIIREIAGVSIPEIFKKYGEKYFRDLESEAIRIASKETSAVIATGGGAVLKQENVLELKKNGRLFFLDRSPEKLIATSDRPLSSDREALISLYNARYDVYCNSADVRLDGDVTAEAVAKTVTEYFVK